MKSRMYEVPITLNHNEYLYWQVFQFKQNPMNMVWIAIQNFLFLIIGIALIGLKYYFKICIGQRSAISH